MLAVAIQPNGKIVAAGTIEDSNFHPRFALARYNPNGSLDNSFGQGGTTKHDLASDIPKPFAMALQPNGRIVVAGYSYDGINTDFAVARSLGDMRVPSDFDGDNQSDIAVFRGDEGNWYIINSSTGAVSLLNLGSDGDVPAPATYLPQ